jgi:hypothetical protein
MCETEIIRGDFRGYRLWSASHDTLTYVRRYEGESAIDFTLRDSLQSLMGLIKSGVTDTVQFLIVKN